MEKIDVINHAFQFQFGGMSRKELEFLYDICKDKIVLELGSMVGMSSYVIASVAKSISCIDVWSNNLDHLSHDKEQQRIYTPHLEIIGDMYSQFQVNCSGFIDSGKLKMFRGNTQQMVDCFENNIFDIILIDADHSYQGIKNDFNAYKNKLNSTGQFVFHDYGDCMWKGIKHFCDEMVRDNKIRLVNQDERLAVFNLIYE